MASRSREVHENRMVSYGLPLSEPYDTEVVEIVEAALKDRSKAPVSMPEHHGDEGMCACCDAAAVLARLDMEADNA